MQDFTGKAVLAYECGYSENLVREEMGVGAAPGPAVEASTPGPSEAEECVLALALMPYSHLRWNFL